MTNDDGRRLSFVYDNCRIIVASALFFGPRRWEDSLLQVVILMRGVHCHDVL